MWLSILHFLSGCIANLLCDSSSVDCVFESVSPLCGLYSCYFRCTQLPPTPVLINVLLLERDTTTRTTIIKRKALIVDLPTVSKVYSIIIMAKIIVPYRQA